MKQLWYLDLSSNEIYGQIPHWAREIGSTYELEYVNLSHNFITSLPQFQLYGLEELYLQSNLIQESFPPSICNMSNLMYLDMSNNRFGGLIPQCFGNITSSLEMIDMGNNSFQGMIPSLYDGLIDFGNNHFNGTFPGWLGDLPNLQALVLKSNNFHGHIQPSSTVEYSFQSLRVLDLSDNRFVGQLPAKYFQNFNSMKNVVKNSTTPEYLNLGAKYYSFVVAVKGVNQDFPKILVDYTIIDLSNNRFEGHIPNVIGGLNSLIALNLSRNSLIGSIPHALGNLIEIESLDVSWNQLSGEIQQRRIPEGTQFNTFDEKSFEGNVGLCRFPLPKRCSEYIHKPHPEPRKDHDEESGFTWEVVTLGYGCGTLLGLVQEVFGEAGILDSGKASFRHWLWSAILVKKLKQRRALSNSNKGIFLLGALAKLRATVVTYPLLDVKGTMDAILKMIRYEGLHGFYKGMSTKIVHSVLAAAILLMIKRPSRESFIITRRVSFEALIEEKLSHAKSLFGLLHVWLEEISLQAPAFHNASSLVDAAVPYNFGSLNT
ncbi:leucine-rich repeat-containing protein [Tanacetum coccineum]